MARAMAFFCPSFGRSLGQNWFHDLAMNVREPIVAALKFVGEFFVVDTKKVEKGGLKVVNMDGILDCVEADIV